METVALEDLDEVDLLLTELEISRGKGNLILCTVASPAYRDHVIEAIARRFPVRVMAVESGDALISDLRSIKPDEKEVLIWTLPEKLSKDILDALNNFRELFYDNGVPSLVLMTPSALDEVIWKAPDFWRYRGGYHILNGSERGLDYQAVEALSTPLDFSYESKEELLRRIRINEYLRDKISDQRELACILGELGTVYFLLGEPLKAIEHYEQALKISREIGDRGGEGAHLGNLGAAYADLGKPRKAIDYYQQALGIVREIEDGRSKGNWLGNLGAAYADLGELRKAIDYYQQALAIAREIGDRRGEGSWLGNLGAAYADLGELRKAIDYYQQALAIAKEIGDRRGEGNWLGNLGTARAILGEPRKAIDYYQQALAIAREIGDRSGEGNALWNMSLALNEIGNSVQAIECAKEALKILKSIESPHAEKMRRKLHEWEEASNQIQ
jgi:tetratricopeptide (TPR) repeat protein